MPPTQLPLELLLTIAHQLIDDDLDALKSFRQVNRALYDCLNPIFWRQALEYRHTTTERVLTSLIRTNDLAHLKFFLELDIDIDIRLSEFSADTSNEFYNLSFNNNPSPLIVAAYLDNVPLARLLLENGAQVQSFLLGDSAIHSARSAEMVQLLLDFHADPETRRCGLTPLHCYAHRGNIAAMRAVLQRGVEVDPVGEGISTPLHKAAECGNVNAVKLLLEFGADMHKEDQDANTLLHLAATSGVIEAVKLLLEFGADVHKQNHDENTPLHLAVMKGEIETVKLLVERWPEGIQAMNEYWQTPLHLAAEAGKVEMVSLTMDYWSEGVRAKDWGGNTPLHTAIENGNTEAVRLFVERWPEGIKAKNEAGQTPLHRAAAEGWPEIVRLLVDCWPDHRWHQRGRSRREYAIGLDDGIGMDRRGQVLGGSLAGGHDGGKYGWGDTEDVDQMSEEFKAATRTDETEYITYELQDTKTEAQGRAQTK
jgi:ankyrin repeat protein